MKSLPFFKNLSFDGPEKLKVVSSWMLTIRTTAATIHHRELLRVGFISLIFCTYRTNTALQRAYDPSIHACNTLIGGFSGSREPLDSLGGQPPTSSSLSNQPPWTKRSPHTTLDASFPCVATHYLRSLYLQLLTVIGYNLPDKVHLKCFRGRPSASKWSNACTKVHLRREAQEFERNP